MGFAPDRPSDGVSVHSVVRFQSLLSASTLDWEIEALEPGGAFDATVKTLAVDQMLVSDVSAPPIAGRRMRCGSRVERSICIAVMADGACALSQNGIQASGGPGTIFLWDNGNAATFRADRDSRQQSISLPYALAATLIPRLDDLVGRCVSPAEPMGAMVSQHLLQMHPCLPAIPARARPGLLLASINLVGTIFGSVHAGQGSSRASILARAQSYAMAHLGDPSLGPGVIADHIGFSTRYLHMLFEETGMTVAEWIRRRRLAAARADLVARPDVSITDVAMRYGFSESSAFSRSFRRAFGCSPSAVRSDRKPL